jgi:T5SS/PEP-CTERM-associated repeat protein
MTNSCWPTIVITLSLLAVTTSASAATRNWNAADGNWNEPSNWTPTGVPVTGDVVSIAFADGLSRTVNYDYAGPLRVFNSFGIDLTGPGSETATLSMSAASGLNSNVDYIGYNGRGAVVQSAGTSTSASDLYLGYNAGASGSYTLSGPGVLAVTGNQYVGNSGSGALSISNGGYASNADANVGTFAGASGSVNIDGADSKWINSSVLAVGVSGTGSMSITHGGYVSSVNGRIGRETGSSGSVTLNGLSSKWQMTGDLTVGSVSGNGMGTLSVENDSFVHVGNSLAINSVSTVNLNGGTLRFNTINGVERLNYTAGTIQLAGDRSIGSFSMFSTLFPGTNVTIPSGKGLTIEGDTELNTWVTVRGKFSALNVLDITGFGERMIVESGGTANIGTALIGSTFENLDCSITVQGPGSSLYAQTVWIGYEEPGTGTLTIANQAYADIEDLALGGLGRVVLDGGTLRLNNWGRDTFNPTGELVFNAGTLQLRNNRSLALDPAITDFFGTAINLPDHKGLTIEGTATIDSPITIDGGTFTVGQLAGAPLGGSLHRGTLNVTNQAVTIESTGPFGSQLDVDENMTIDVALGITNNGLVTGDGQIGGTFTNASGGELRAQAGRSLSLTGAANSNAGQIRLLGGGLEFTHDLSNMAGATISGNGTLITGSGLTNLGTMNFAGTANIIGSVNNAPGGKIVSGGGGATIFYDDVTNNGEIRTSTNAFTVFFGNVSGSGTFTGTGTVNFEGGLSPGSSPAAVSFAGNVALGIDSVLNIELGGTSPGTQYDQINVAGQLALDGKLTVTLIDGFMPSDGQVFDVLNAASTVGSFASLVLPENITWDLSQLSTGLLRVVSVGLAGDFNHNGVVDAAD